jgi:hypothetical protein
MVAQRSVQSFRYFGSSFYARFEYTLIEVIDQIYIRHNLSTASVFIPNLNGVINISHGEIDIWVEMFLPKNASRKIGRFVFNKYSFIAMSLRPLNSSLQERFPDALASDIWSCISRFNLSSIGVLEEEAFSVDG